MILKRFYNEKLAQASYLVGCPRCGESIVIDPNRDIAQYLDSAKAEGVKVTAVTETHIHADYLSGSRELAAASGATLYLSDEGDSDWKYEFSNEENVKLVKDGDEIRAGSVRLNVVRTPGHTPEHISFVLVDEATLDEPLGSFTGDFIFVGDVGRPDLLERAAGVSGTMELGAKSMFQSLKQFQSRYEGQLILWPGHGAGSACGKSLSGVPVTTLGYEAKANWAFKATQEQAFVESILMGQPDPPAYFKHMKRMNKSGPAILGAFKTLSHEQDAALLRWLDAGEVIVDIRSVSEVAHGAIPGAYHIPLGKSFPNWAGWLLPFDRPIHLLANSAEQAAEAVYDLAMIGLDDVRGWVGTSAIRFYEESRGHAYVTSQISIQDAAKVGHLPHTMVLDVRAKSEYDQGHIPGSTNIPLGHLEEQIASVPTNQLIIVHCAGGMRSMIAQSILRKHGAKQIRNMPGGFMEYAESGLPIEIASA